MRSLADGLPSDIAKKLHPAWHKNEAEYWAARTALLVQYNGQWIAFADGGVIASGRSLVEVLRAAHQSGRLPYVACVGREEEPCRMRRASFPYDSGYPGEVLPLIPVEFRGATGTPGLVLDRVIPDTGADASALPWVDCERLQLDPASGVPGLMGGVRGSAAATIVFLAWVRLDGRDYPCRLQADFHGRERILALQQNSWVDFRRHSSGVPRRIADRTAGNGVSLKMLVAADAWQSGAQNAWTATAHNPGLSPVPARGSRSKSTHEFC